MQFSGANLFNKPKISFSENVQIIFVSDMFIEDYQGGAELTTEALIESSPFEIFRLHSKDVTMELLEQGHKKFWIFGNFANLDLNLIPTIIKNLKYSVLEYDYKYCKYRSPEKHKMNENKLCNCEETIHGKLISAFYLGACSMWWMSEEQMNIYGKLFPFLVESEQKNTVLSSVFNFEWFVAIKQLRNKYKDQEKTKYVYLDSPSWIKGADQAKKWCIDNNVEYEGIWGLSYSEVLEKLAQAKAFVCLPSGKDTCPRMVIEAKVLGCELILNDNVQHKNEEWFVTDNILAIEQYLYSAKSWFWNGIRSDMNYVPTISGYTTTKDCIKQKYPFEASIKSMLAFCGEVVVVDGGSQDGTCEFLTKWSKEDPRIKVKQSEKDWTHPRFAVFDGQLKAEARELCEGDFCYQFDVDEITHKQDAEKIKNLVYNFPKEFDLIALPVIEYWGGADKVRIDIQPWKWRLSRNKSYITHGIPGHLRQYDENGNLYSKPGSDGCCFINKETLEPINFGNFYTPDVALVKHAAQNGNEEALKEYEKWFNQIINVYPAVHHFSWFNLERKIKTYRDYWGKHWKSLYDIEIEDTAENNMMFDIPWSEVTDDMIKDRAKVFKNEMGGWIWHSKWDGTKTDHMTVNCELPEFVLDWIKEN